MSVKGAVVGVSIAIGVIILACALTALAAVHPGATILGLFVFLVCFGGYLGATH
jgi:hypothetical protein